MGHDYRQRRNDGGHGRMACPKCGDRRCGGIRYDGKYKHCSRQIGTIFFQRDLSLGKDVKRNMLRKSEAKGELQLVSELPGRVQALMPRS